MLRILSSKHEVREQYRIYDANSFIADFGGFLGLLLGHSLFGMYCLGEDWIFARINKICRSNKTVQNDGSGGSDGKVIAASKWSGTTIASMAPIN